MKKKKRKKVLFIIIIFILIIFLFQIMKRQKDKFQDELIFFKLFSVKQEETNQIYPVYDFYVSYKNIDFKNIYLANTLNPKNIVHEKIAPGIEGAFEMVLHTKQKINYRIQFKSINSKPQNLYFQLEGKDEKYTKLEDLESQLRGRITEKKKIKIYWKWDYDGNKMQDIQDTKDGQRIQQYNFIIYTIGE